MAEMAGFDTRPEALARMITTGQARISAAGAGKHFHDITAYSLGLLTDVRSGGFKADLNLAFESDTVPKEMDEAALFGSRLGSRPFDAPIRPMTGALAKITPGNPYVAPMSWRQLREYYRVYRSGFANGSSMQPVTWSGGKPATRRLIMGRGKNEPNGKWEERDTKGYARDLVILRQTWIIATKSEANSAAPGGLDYYILAIPVITLWNPYNVTMRVDSGEVSALGALFWSVGMRQRTYRGDVLLGDVRFPDSDTDANGKAFKGPNHNVTANQLGYRMIATQGNRGGTIEFQPGQVRVFSTDAEVLVGAKAVAAADAMSTRHFFASPGYTPVQDSAPNVLRGLKYRVNPGTGTGALSFSLRLAEAAQANDNYYYGSSTKSGLVWRMHEVFGAKYGAVYENGTLVEKQGAGEWQDVAYLGANAVDWVTSSELADAWIVRDEPANRAQWGAPGSPPMPVGIFSIVAKSAERLAYDVTNGFGADFRNRGWLHAPPTRLGNLLMNPVDLNRADSPYQLHFRPVNGDQEVSQYLQADGPNGYFGGGYTPDLGQTHVTALNLPAAPLMNLGSFAGIRMDHARARFNSSARYENLKQLAHAGGAFGAGIGNAYAHPMISPDKVYTRNDFGNDTGFAGNQATNLPICDDYWDHLFLANEELWDSWFCSGIAPVVGNGSVVTPKKSVAGDFFSSKPTQLSANYQPDLRDKTAQELASLVETTTAASGENGWDRIGSHILNRGQFNVNSTSKEAWKALLMSLADRPIASNDPASGTSVVPGQENEVILSRHPLANSPGVAEGPGDDSAWRGIRKLGEPQIDKLAEEIVRQVKLRGPFLNMAEFINRRLTDDATGVTGTLQAAIDWDEFNAGYNGSTSGSGESINKDYKAGDAMIAESALPAKYPNPKAATGSRYAGIPGYVMQSDLLQGLAGSLSARGDTFLVRAYGESLAADGKVAARAWCEAVVQRVPDYVDPADDPAKKLRRADKVPGAAPDLDPLNGRFGRRFQITTFRWLNNNEV
jgi:hypothetical protein